MNLLFDLPNDLIVDLFQFWLQSGDQIINCSLRTLDSGKFAMDSSIFCKLERLSRQCRDEMFRFYDSCSEYLYFTRHSSEVQSASGGKMRVWLQKFDKRFSLQSLQKKHNALSIRKLVLQCFDRDYFDFIASCSNLVSLSCTPLQLCNLQWNPVLSQLQELEFVPYKEGRNCIGNR